MSSSKAKEGTGRAKDDFGTGADRDAAAEALFRLTTATVQLGTRDISRGRRCVGLRGDRGVP